MSRHPEVSRDHTNTHTIARLALVGITVVGLPESDGPATPQPHVQHAQLSDTELSSLVRLITNEDVAGRELLGTDIDPSFFTEQPINTPTLASVAPEPTFVVEPGGTLWDIAQDSDPDTDPGVVVAAMYGINRNLPEDPRQLQPGTEVAVPRITTQDASTISEELTFLGITPDISDPDNPPDTVTQMRSQLSKFQESAGLPSNGHYDEETANRLNEVENMMEEAVGASGNAPLDDKEAAPYKSLISDSLTARGLNASSISSTRAPDGSVYTTVTVAGNPNAQDSKKREDQKIVLKLDGSGPHGPDTQGVIDQALDKLWKNIRGPVIITSIIGAAALAGITANLLKKYEELGSPNSRLSREFNRTLGQTRDLLTDVQRTPGIRPDQYAEFEQIIRGVTVIQERIDRGSTNQEKRRIIPGSRKPIYLWHDDVLIGAVITHLAGSVAPNFPLIPGSQRPTERKFELNSLYTYLPDGKLKRMDVIKGNVNPPQQVQARTRPWGRTIRTSAFESITPEWVSTRDLKARALEVPLDKLSHVLGASYDYLPGPRGARDTSIVPRQLPGDSARHRTDPRSLWELSVMPGERPDNPDMRPSPTPDQSGTAKDLGQPEALPDGGKAAADGLQPPPLRDQPPVPDGNNTAGGRGTNTGPNQYKPLAREFMSDEQLGITKIIPETSATTTWDEVVGYFNSIGYYLGIDANQVNVLKSRNVQVPIGRPINDAPTFLTTITTALSEYYAETTGLAVRPAPAQSVDNGSSSAVQTSHTPPASHSHEIFLANQQRSADRREARQQQIATQRATREAEQQAAFEAEIARANEVNRKREEMIAENQRLAEERRQEQAALHEQQVAAARTFEAANRQASADRSASNLAELRATTTANINAAADRAAAITAERDAARANREATRATREAQVDARAQQAQDLLDGARQELAKARQDLDTSAAARAATRPAPAPFVPLYETHLPPRPIAQPAAPPVPTADPAPEPAYSAPAPTYDDTTSYYSTADVGTGTPSTYADEGSDYVSGPDYTYHEGDTDYEAGAIPDNVVAAVDDAASVPVSTPAETSNAPALAVQSSDQGPVDLSSPADAPSDDNRDDLPLSQGGGGGGGGGAAVGAAVAGFGLAAVAGAIGAMGGGRGQDPPRPSPAPEPVPAFSPLQDITGGAIQ